MHTMSRVLTGNQPVLEVTEIKLVTLRTFPPRLKISVSGTVSSRGWSYPQLVPSVYIKAPPDGIYDFDFVATPPDGVAAQVITPIGATYTWQTLPQNLKGVRVHAATNCQVALLTPEMSLNFLGNNSWDQG
jgi:hypothetical protein